MEIKTIGVVGAGQMGSGIVQVAASSGFSVIMNDIKDEFVERGFAAIEKSLGRMVKKEKITPEDQKAILGRIAGSTSLGDMVEADFVVEAATENEALKLKIFTDLDENCKKGIILASNTSSISITKIGNVTKKARKSNRDAFYEPGSNDGTCGNHQRPGHVRRDQSGNSGSFREDGKDSSACQRFPRDLSATESSCR